jgi:hypothetical protein
MRVLALAGAVAPAPALAEWATLTGEAIAATLIAHDIVYGDIAWERHAANGILLYRSSEGPFARTSLGEWRVVDDTRCLRWTRAMAWECYTVEVEDEDGIRFTDPFGNVSAGRLVPRGDR